jgi:hypothetical protein
MTAARTHDAARLLPGEVFCCSAHTTALAAPHDVRCFVWHLADTVSPALLLATCSCRGDDGHTTGQG